VAYVGVGFRPIREPLQNPATLPTPQGYPVIQLTFTDAEQQIKRRKTRRERFLEQVEQLVPLMEDALHEVASF